MDKYIVDLSHHQESSKINYSVFCSRLNLAIIRVQYGKETIDREYKKHIAKMQEYNVPYGVYAWTRGKSEELMREEARLFFERSKEQNPLFYALDVEEQTMTNMRSGINAFLSELRKLTDKPIGCYIANHLYKSFNIEVKKFDFIWIPKYSNTQPVFDCDLWQYTSDGKIDGYAGRLDLNKLVNGATLDKFLGKGKEVIANFLDYPIPTRVLKLTKPITTGSDVKWVQERLLFDESEIDGKFGKITYQRVKEFQKTKGLKVDGIVGNKTIAQLKLITV